MTRRPSERTGRESSRQGWPEPLLLLRMMEDREVPHAVRVKIAQDLLERAGLTATQVHQIVPTTEAPIKQFFNLP